MSYPPRPFARFLPPFCGKTSSSHILFARILIIVMVTAITSTEVCATKTHLTTLCEITARQLFEPFKPNSKTIKSDCRCALKKLGGNTPKTILEWETSGAQSPLLALTNCSERWIVDAYAKETYKSSRERLRRQGFNFEQINEYSLCVGEASFNHMKKAVQEDVTLDRELQKNSMENCERRASFN